MDTIPGMRARKNGWTIEDEKILRRLLLAGYTEKEAGDVLGRSPKAVGNKARALGMSQHTTPQGGLQWYEKDNPPVGAARRNKPKAASAQAWEDPDREPPRFAPDYLPRIWTEAMERIKQAR